MVLILQHFIYTNLIVTLTHPSAVPVPVNEELLAEMLSMGFSDIRARKGLVNGSTVEGI